MDYFFHKCSSLNSLDLSSFITTNVESMQFMFNYCTGLRELNLRQFNTSKCTNFDAAFSGVKNINIIINKDNNENLLEKIYGDYKIINE